MAMMIDGKKISESIKNNLKSYFSNTKYKDSYVAILQVGNDEGTNIYIQRKSKFAEEIGIKVKHIKLDSTETLSSVIISENKEENCIGMLLQSPLPNKEDLIKYTSLIDTKKDIDCMNPSNLGRTMEETKLFPATVSAVLKAIQSVDNNTEDLESFLKGKNVVIVNHSIILGRPLSEALLSLGATVTVCHSQTKELALLTKNSDILITGVGKENLITSEMVKDGVILIDCGIVRTNEGKIRGDVELSTHEKSYAYTPVPGGIGPITVACLFDNLMLLLVK